MPFRSIGSPAIGTGNAAAVPVPAGLEVDDVVVICAYIHDNNDSTFTLPTGFTATGGDSNNGTTRGQLRAWWKRITVAGDTTDEPDGDYDISWTNSDDYEMVAVAFSGIVRAGVPVDAVNNANSASGTATTTPSVSVSPVNFTFDAVFFGSNHASNAGAWTPPTGMTGRYDNSASPPAHLHVATEDAVTGAGAAYAKTATLTGTTGSSVPKAQMIALISDRTNHRSGSITTPVTNTTQSVTLTAHQAGDRMLIACAMKPDTVTDPTINQGWTKVKTLTGGPAVPSAADAGPMKIVVFAKDAASSSETNPTITWGAGHNTAMIAHIVYMKPVGYSWRDAIAADVDWVQGGQDTDVSTSVFDATSSAFTNPPQTRDAIHMFFAINNDNGGPGLTGSQTISATGLSSGSIVSHGHDDNTFGNDCGIAHTQYRGFTGTASSGVSGSVQVASGSAVGGCLAAVAMRVEPAAIPPPFTAGWGINLN